jgi:glutathione synthase/RimK-type ligase-like ATP-grasp enzyme
MRIALVTCAELPDLDPDDRELLAPLRARGADPVGVVWDDPGADWDAFDLVLLRSPWDYALRRDEFVAWAETVPRLLNPAAVVRWNTDKTYLHDLQAAGAPVIETAVVRPGDAWTPPAGEYVVKPAVSAGSRDTARYGPGEEERALAHVAALGGEGRTALVQPYAGRVDEHGETALLYLGGAFSHGIVKSAMLAPGQDFESGLFRAEQIGPREPADDELAVAERVLDAMPFDRAGLPYARVDLIRGDDGAPRLLELELTEPSLFLLHAPRAAERLADAIVAAAAR